MPPPVFLRKSAEVIENKGQESEKERQESSRARKRKEVKEIKEVEEVEELRSASFGRLSGVRIGVRRWVRGWRARREILSLCADLTLRRGRLEVGERNRGSVPISRLGYGMGYAKTTDRRDG